MATFVTPTEVSPGATGWQDADATAAGVPAGAAGVIVHVVNTAAGAAAWGLRKNGSTDDRTTTMQATDHQWAAIGLDASGIFEVSMPSTTTFDVYVVGYFTSGEAFFFTNAVDRSTGTTGSFQDVDITADKDGSHSAVTALAAFWEISGGTTSNFGIRMNGSTDSRLQDNEGGQHVFGCIGLDANEIFEQQIANVAIDLFLVGYLVDSGVFNTNGADRSTGTTGSYVDMTALSSGAVGGIYESFSASGTTTHALRKNGSTEDIYPASGAAKHIWAMVECDESFIVEQKISGTGKDCYEIGYFEASPAGAITSEPGVGPVSVTGLGTALGWGIGMPDEP